MNKRSSRNNLKARKSSMNDNETIKFKLAERIKEFRKELRSNDGRE